VHRASPLGTDPAMLPPCAGLPQACEHSAIRCLQRRRGVLYPRRVASDVPAFGGSSRLEPTAHLYRALVEEIPAIVYVDSNEVPPRTLYASPQVTDMVGYTPQEWAADPTLWPSVIHPVDREMVLAEWSRSVATGIPFRCEYRFVRRNGDVMWVSDESRLILDEAGGARFWQGVILDITDRRHAQEVARNSEARYQALIEGIPAVVYEMGPDDERRTLYVSPHVEQVLGYSRKEWLDQPDIWMELLHPDDREIQLAAHDLHNETGEPWTREYRLIANDGHVVWVSDLATLVRDDEGQPRTWQGVMLDISAQKDAEEALQRANDELEFRVLARTSQLADVNEMMSLEIGERRRAEEQLRLAEERYRMLVEHLPAVLYIWDTSERNQNSDHYTSPMIQQLTGFTRAEWMSSPDFWIERIHPHDRERVMSGVVRSEATGEPFDDEYRILAKDGRVVWIYDRATLLTRHDDGRPRMFQGFLVDITARKEAEAKARAAEERYRVLADEGPVMAYDVSLDHTAGDVPRTEVHHLSKQLQRILGTAGDELRTDPRAWVNLVHPDDLQRVRDSFRASWDSGDPWSEDYRMLTSDGRIVWLHTEGRAVERDERGRPTRFHGILVDTTVRQQAELELRTAEERYRTLVESVPGVGWIETVDTTTGATRMTYISPQAERYFGWTAEELLAEPGHFQRMLHPDDRERVMQYTRRVERSGADEWHARYRVLTRSGAVVTVESHATARRDPDGRIVAWYGFAMSTGGVMDAVTAPAVDVLTDPVPERTPKP
jgi:PAS domain S-box-containing protein